MVSGLTRVDYTTGNPRKDPDTGEVMRRDARVREVTETAPEGADASGTQEPAVTVSGTPDTKEAVSGGQATTSGEKPAGGSFFGIWEETPGEEDAEAPSCEVDASEENCQSETRAWDNSQGAREEPLQEPGDKATPESEVGRDPESCQGRACSAKLQFSRSQLVEEKRQFDPFSILFQAEER